MLSWTWNNTLTFNNSNLTIEIGFTSNGQHFDSLILQRVDSSTRYLGYCNGTTCTLAYDSGTWINSSLKNITFDTLPNEQLMSILSANATVNKNISKVDNTVIYSFNTIEKAIDDVKYSIDKGLSRDIMIDYKRKLQNDYLELNDENKKMRW